jgi:hypothetical protein
MKRGDIWQMIEGMAVIGERHLKLIDRIKAFENDEKFQTVYNDISTLARNAIKDKLKTYIMEEFRLKYGESNSIIILMDMSNAFYSSERFNKWKKEISEYLNEL